METIEQAKTIKAHILDEFVDGWDSSDALANLTQQLKAFDHLPTMYERAKALVEGGTFLVYHYQVQDFFDELDIETINLDNHARWDIYVHIIASAIVTLVEGGK